MPTPTIREVWTEEFTDTLDPDRIHHTLNITFHDNEDRQYSSEILAGYTGEAVARALRHMADKLEHDPKLR